MARSYLKKRGNVWWAQLAVPTDLQPFLDKKLMERTLKTTDYGDAKRRLLGTLAEWHDYFDDVRRRRELTTDDKAEATWQHYEGVIERYELEKADRPTADDIEKATLKAGLDAITSGAHEAGPIAAINAMTDVEILAGKVGWEARRREALAKRLRADLAQGDTTMVDSYVADYVDRNKLLIATDSPDRADLAQRIMRASIESLDRTFERDRGDYSGLPKDPIVKPPTGTTRERAKAGESIFELFTQYAAENPKQIKADTLDQARHDIGTFVDYVGSTYPAHRIDKKAVREWKALLIAYPVKATETKAFAGMKIVQIVRHNETVGKPVLSARTVNRYLSSLGAFCNWLVAHGYLEHNPTADMSLGKVKVRKIVFTVDQLNTLFKSPLFTGCQSADEWRNLAKPGNVMIRDHRYWVALIMLFSGARPGEIGQLSLADLRQQHGHWIMRITDEGDEEQSIKNNNSIRIVPVHPELERLGLIKYRNAMEAQGETLLFPTSHRNSRGQMNADWSREFSRYLERLGMKEKGKRGLKLYSFRDGATDALRDFGYLDEQFGFILGHGKQGMTAHYGVKPQGILEQRVELIRAIKYPGLDLSHLYH